MDFEKSVVENEKMVHYIINRYFGQYRRFRDDLFSIGKIGLVKAVKNHNPEKEAKLSSYACICIKNEIFSYLRRFSREKYKGEQDMLSLEGPTPNDPESTLYDIVGTDRDMVSRQVESKIFVEELLSCLNDRQREMVERFYGLNGKPEQNQKEIAEVMGTSPKAVSETIRRAFRRIRAYQEAS